MAQNQAKTRDVAVATIPPRWPHQEASFKFFSSTPFGLDFSDPGTGKTRVQIDVYNARPKKTRGRWLILCPKTLMVAAWVEDIEKYAPNLTVSTAFAEQREEAFQMDTDVVVLNIDGVKWLTDKKNLKYLAEFDHLTIDEITAYKHPTSQRSKAAALIRRHFKYRFGLTGTPNPHSVTELWHPTLIIDDGKRLGTSFYKFRSSVQAPTQIGPNANHVRWDDKPGAEQAVHELLNDITIRHAFETVMTHVPPNHKDVKQFTLSPKAQKIYVQMENDLILSAEDGKVVSAVHAAALRSKLLQIASGAVYNNDGEGAYTIIDKQRYELIGDLIEEREHSVVFFNWKHQRDLLAAECEARGLSFALIDGSVPQRERDRIVADYQAGRYRSILLHPRTGAHGLTLTRGDTTIFSSPISEADLFKQGLMRIYRGMQDKVTNTILIQARGTVEDKVYAQLESGTTRMTDLLDLVKARRAA